MNPFNIHKIVLILICFSTYNSVQAQLNNLNTHLKSATGIKVFTFPEPELWYSFDSLGTTVYDISGNNHHGTITNDVIRDSGVVTFAYQNNGYIEVPASTKFNGVGDFTAAYKIALDTFNVHRQMILLRNGAYGNNFSIRYNNGFNSIAVYKYNFAVIKKLEINDTLFHELAIVCNDTLVSIYFDGIAIETNLRLYARDNVNNPIFIGEDGYGTLEEFKYYTSALNSHQVKTIFNPDTTSPSVPENIQGNLTSSNLIELGWTRSLDSVAVCGYEIYRDSILIANTQLNNYIDTVPDSNATYHYKLRAFDYSGNFSNFSQAIEIEVCKNDNPVENLNTEYSACQDSSITIEAKIKEGNYNYSWQRSSSGSWMVITDNEIYSQTNTPALLIQKIDYGSLPQAYRLGVSNNCDIFYTDSVLIHPKELNSVYGTVITGNRMLMEGSVYLYHDSGPSSKIIVDSVEITNGIFSFNNICPGYYKLKARPTGNASGQYAESYYPGVLFYQDATTINVNSNVYDIVISLTPSTLIQETAPKPAISIYPTRIKNELNIESESLLLEGFEVSIIDIHGITVHNAVINENSQFVKLIIPMLPASMYMVRINSKHKNLFSQKIIVY